MMVMKSTLLRSTLALAMCTAAIFATEVRAQEAAAPAAPAAQPAAPAAQSADQEERLAAARELLDVTGATKQFDGMLFAMTKGLMQGGKADSAEVKALVAKVGTYKDELMGEFAKIYADEFSAAEMKEVAQFYRSPTGKKFVSSMPSLMEKGSTVGLKFSQRLQKDIGELSGAEK